VERKYEKELMFLRKENIKVSTNSGQFFTAFPQLQAVTCPKCAPQIPPIVKEVVKRPERGVVLLYFDGNTTEVK